MDNEQRQHLESLLKTYQPRLYVLEEQAAAFGLLVPPQVCTEIAGIKAEIATITAQLDSAPLLLPSPVADFVGRDAEIAQLTHIVSQALAHQTATAVSVRGMGGLGKTQFALTVAQRLASSFPDALVLVELRGATAPVSPTQALQSVIRAFEPLAKLPDDLTQLQARYCTVLAGKRVLILADDAWDAAQVRPLLPPAICALLVTSRQRFTLPGMAAFDLDMLSPQEAEDLLRGICPRIGNDALKLAQLCGFLPLALRVSASLLANDDTRSVKRYLQTLTDKRARLGLLRDPDDPSLDVESALGLSYAALDPAAQHVLCRLSIFPSTFDQAAALRVLDLPEEEGTPLLSLLRRRCLLEWDATAERYSLHDLVRAFAAVHLEDNPNVRLRYARHYLQVAQHSTQLYWQGGEHMLAGLALFDQERVHIDTSWRWLRERGEATSAECDELLLAYDDELGYLKDLRYNLRSERLPQIEAAAAAARRLGRKEKESALLFSLGNVYRDLGELRRAVDLYEQHIAELRTLGKRPREGYAVGALGRVYYLLGDVRRAHDLFQQRLDIARENGEQRETGHALGSLGMAYVALDEMQRGLELFEQQLHIFREIGDWRGESVALGNLGSAYTALGESCRAIGCHEQQLSIARRIGDRRFASGALDGLGRAYAAMGDVSQATMCYQQALQIAQEIEDRYMETLANWNLGELMERQGDLARAVALMQVRVDFEQKIGHVKVAQHTVLLEQVRQRLGADREHLHKLN